MFWINKCKDAVEAIGNNAFFRGLSTLRSLILILSAFGAFIFGVGYYIGSNDVLREKREPQATTEAVQAVNSTRKTECEIEGLSKVENDYNDRVGIVKKRLFDQQDRLMNQNLFTEERDSILQSMELLKAELVHERETYLRAMDALERKCASD